MNEGSEIDITALLRGEASLERKDFRGEGLSGSDLDPDPLRAFATWMEEAVSLDREGATAMTVATSTAEGVPSARLVLLKGFDERGFVFFTNYESRKARELEENPRVALVFYWPDCQRQVRVAGDAERTSPEESLEYFSARPRDKQVAVWASSRQSQPIENRAALDAKVAEISERFRNRPVPLPEWWGGYRVRPSTMEFWQGRPSRLHDRLLYTRRDEGWSRQRLSP